MTRVSNWPNQPRQAIGLYQGQILPNHEDYRSGSRLKVGKCIL
ncbi:hypothetical protein GcC1_113006 [Golovinomyces cichoracearum]|uniref:Uncharacterized protein n=1 Tax=Golovinomyces cichoracearum TaxID=62708 RepID=A0A420I8G4_9PEZI|nr:hypothetical protein GcC1_113006 [Golovinomyces cichoracearum]